jgi:hypothetical protein
MVASCSAIQKDRFFGFYDVYVRIIELPADLFYSMLSASDKEEVVYVFYENLLE